MALKPFIGLAWIEPTPQEEEHGFDPEIVVSLRTVLARDRDHAIARLLVNAPAEASAKSARLRVEAVPLGQVVQAATTLPFGNILRGVNG